MTEITIQISDEQASQLKAEAERLNVTVEEAAVRRLFQSEQAEGAPEIGDEEFERILDYVTEKNDELMRRLA